jgi:hypothetical protein
MTVRALVCDAYGIAILHPAASHHPHHPHLVAVGLGPAHRPERDEGANYGATIGAIAAALPQTKCDALTLTEDLLVADSAAGLRP